MKDDAAPARERSHLAVSIPVALVNRTKMLLEHCPELGYTNKSSFAEEAMRRWLEHEEARALDIRSLYGIPPKPSLNFDAPRHERKPR